MKTIVTIMIFLLIPVVVGSMAHVYTTEDLPFHLLFVQFMLMVASIYVILYVIKNDFFDY